jgi:hypothetical protein
MALAATPDLPLPVGAGAGAGAVAAVAFPFGAPDGNHSSLLLALLTLLASRRLVLALVRVVLAPGPVPTAEGSHSSALLLLLLLLLWSMARPLPLLLASALRPIRRGLPPALVLTPAPVDVPAGLAAPATNVYVDETGSATSSMSACFSIWCCLRLSLRVKIRGFGPLQKAHWYCTDLSCVLAGKKKGWGLARRTHALGRQDHTRFAVLGTG